MNEIQWVHGTTTYAKSDPTTFIAVSAEGFNLFQGRALRGTFGTLAEAKAAAR